MCLTAMFIFLLDYITDWTVLEWMLVVFFALFCILPIFHRAAPFLQQQTGQNDRFPFQYIPLSGDSFRFYSTSISRCRKSE